jgi:dinuclear metal center YbgI/SA1388 family protein
MTVQEIMDVLEHWAPTEIAWERDNSGLQCGVRSARVRGILVTLDPTVEAVEEARRLGANMIVSHHPLLFHSLRSVDPSERVGKILALLLKYGIALYGAHTTVDFTQGGTSHVLAERLGLTGVEFLHRSHRLQRKLVTFVPRPSADRVASAMAAAGAGIIGNYDHCSFRAPGTGTFRGSAAAHPAVGQTGRLEKVEEIRLEVVVPAPRMQRVLHALRGAHPYEDVAFDIYPTENISPEYGAGVIGELLRPATLRAFLGRIKRSLRAPRLRWSGSSRTLIKRVAVCGGSGGELLEGAVAGGAQAFVTADVRYHAFRDAEGRIALIDAGHYETELPVVEAIARRLKQGITAREAAVTVRTSRTTTNPVQYS